jgi:hypothetical protein
MKGIFYILLLLNLGYFGWQYSSQNDNTLSQSLTAAMSSDKGELKLLSELSDEEKIKLLKNPQKLVEEAQGDMEPETDASAMVCYQAGPFVSTKARNSFASKISAFGMEKVDQWTGSEKAVRYWVYLPPMRSKAEARRVVSDLNRKGIKDVAVVSSGKYKYAISLGLFSSKEYARERVALMQKYAYSPKINESTVSKTLYWVSFKGESELSASRQARLLRDFGSAKLTQAPCK